MVPSMLSASVTKPLLDTLQAHSHNKLDTSVRTPNISHVLSAARLGSHDRILFYRLGNRDTNSGISGRRAASFLIEYNPRSMIAVTCCEELPYMGRVN